MTTTPAPTGADIATLLPGFEAWARKKGFDLNRYDWAEYRSRPTQLAWEVWAAAKLESVSGSSTSTSQGAAIGKRAPVKLSPELKAALDKAAETGATVAETPDGIVFINRGHDYGDSAHLECTACGGSGHIEDQKLNAGGAAPGDALDARAILPRVTPEMVAQRRAILDMLDKQRERMDAMRDKYGMREAQANDAACWQYIEEHATTHGGGQGFTITCFVPVDHEDMQCGVLAAIATSTSKEERK